MNILFALITCWLGILIFILHSYFKRGFGLTFNFFFFAFLVAVIKEGPIHINGILMKNPTMPYEFLVKDASVVARTTLAIVGWVFTFYLGWYIAERVARRLDGWRERIFTVALISGLATASIGYCVEATAIGIRLWRWTIEDVRLAEFLVGTPFIVFETWMHFPTQYLLLPYFLIACSRYKRVDWKGIFFVIPFIHSISTACKPELVRTSIEYIALFTLFILAFISPLRFDFSGVKLPVFPRFAKRQLLETLPMIVLIVLLFILVFLDLVKIHNLKLFISLLPIGFFVLLAIKSIPLLWITFFALVCLLIFKNLAVPALIPIVIVLMFKMSAKINTILEEKKPNE